LYESDESSKKNLKKERLGKVDAKTDRKGYSGRSWELVIVRTETFNRLEDADQSTYQQAVWEQSCATLRWVIGHDAG